jgi:aldehyde dehydrogenase (NAD+)
MSGAKTYQLFVNGEFTDASNNELRNDFNPASNAVFARVNQATAADVKKAIDAAEAAFKTWKNAAPAVRERILLKAADLMEERADELRDVLMDESGSTFLKASFEVHETPDFLRAMAGEARRVMGSTFQSNYKGVMSYSIRRPLGIVAAISPFNFPLLLSTRKIGWALAAGNCVVLKPSDYTPVIALKLGQILFDAGLPGGVLNVVTGRGSVIGNSLIDDPRVRFVSFTGSSEVGKQVGARCAVGNKKYALEMGGKNPVVILNDADVDYAVNVAAFSNFMHQGQICMTGSRVIVEAGIYDEFCKRFAAKVSRLKVGSPREKDTIVGPLIDPNQSPFIKGLLDEAVAEGARILTGGTYDGAFFQPTVVVDVTPAMSIFKTECFGPAASVCKANDYLHAIELANDNDYGLSSAIITNDLQKAIAVSEAIEAGMVHINGPSVRDEGIIPFGGVKNSGLGREGGHYSIDELTELKWVTIQIGQQQFPF